MIRSLPILTFLLLLAVTGCQTTKQTTTAGAAGTRYYENLSSTRPPIEQVQKESKPEETRIRRDLNAYSEPKHTVNKQVDAVLDSIDRINLTRRFIDGYTIQVYSGLKREEALNVKKDLLMYLPKLESDVHYNQPNFRVKSGRYLTQLEALKDFLQVRKYFPSAIVVPDRIPIN